MSRKTSFKEQMFRVLNSKNCFGQSKYRAKQESYQNGNNDKVSGIYSKKTMKDYKQVATQFNDIVNITLHFFLKDVRPMQYSAKNHSTSVV